jgi:hypothetical protein
MKSHMTVLPDEQWPLSVELETPGRSSGDGQPTATGLSQQVSVTDEPVRQPCAFNPAQLGATADLERADRGEVVSLAGIWQGIAIPTCWPGSRINILRQTTMTLALV